MVVALGSRACRGGIEIAPRDGDILIDEEQKALTEQEDQPPTATAKFDFVAQLSYINRRSGEMQWHPPLCARELTRS